MTPKRPQNGPQNRPTIDLGANLAPKRGPRGSKRASEVEFGRFLIDFGPNFDRFWSDLGPISDRFGTDSRPRFYLTLRSHSTISSQCKLRKHLFQGIGNGITNRELSRQLYQILHKIANDHCDNATVQLRAQNATQVNGQEHIRYKDLTGKTI